MSDILTAKGVYSRESGERQQQASEWTWGARNPGAKKKAGGKSDREIGKVDPG